MQMNLAIFVCKPGNQAQHLCSMAKTNYSCWYSI